MQLYLLRHGQAEAPVTSDEARRLTSLGCTQTQWVMNTRCQLMAGLQTLWVSPLVRAQQTADIARDFLAPLPSHTYEQLVPEASLDALYELLSTYRGDSLLLVGHQPLLGKVLNDLCGYAPDTLPMGTSSLAALTLEVPARGMAQLQWLQHAEG